jgi:hypothetical protein
VFLRLSSATLLTVSAVLAQVPLQPFASVAVPPDPNEPVTGIAQALSSQADRSNALALMNRARLRVQLHAARTPSFQISATFTSSYGVGSMTETWMNGQKWRWSGTVGNNSAVRIPADGLHYGLPQGGAIPPALHLLRNAIFWAAAGVPDSGGSLRSSAVIWNGKPATCLLFGPRGEQIDGGRSWDEEEYCIDDASGVLQVHSFVPGTYVDYTYNTTPFHGRSAPSGITIFIGNKKMMDAQVTIADAGTPDESLFVPTEQMRSYGPVGTAMMANRWSWEYPSASVSDLAKPVIVRASVDGEGSVVAAEVSIASDAALAETALDLVKGFPPNGNTREIYVQIKFVAQQ